MAISGPIALYSNLPIEAQFYEPSRFVISDVTLGKTTTVTTSEDNNYVIGQVVRLIIPATFGCFQLNGTQGIVLSLPASDQVEIAIDSSKNVNKYTSSTATTVAQILAIANVNSGQINSNGLQMESTFIPGSFQNISPN